MVTPDDPDWRVRVIRCRLSGWHDPSAGRWIRTTPTGASHTSPATCAAWARMILAWWQLYGWCQLLARPWAGSLLWGTVTCLLYVLGVAPWAVTSGVPLRAYANAFLWFDFPWVVALIVMHLVAAWFGARTWWREHAVLAAAVARICGGLMGGAVSVWALFPDLLRWDVFFSALVWLGFTSLMVLLRTGLPASPRTPSRETLTLANLGCRLRRTATTVAVAAVLGADSSIMPVGHNGRMSSSLRPPAQRPCESCPYRRDVPAGIWASEEYAKLRRYDADTPDQPTGLFQCHQADAGSGASRVCGGWAGCHDGEELLALRLALLDGRIDTVTYKAVVEYVSPVPLFSSGNEAAAHGGSGIETPDEKARHLMSKITRTRNDLVQ